MDSFFIEKFSFYHVVVYPRCLKARFEIESRLTYIDISAYRCIKIVF